MKTFLGRFLAVAVVAIAFISTSVFADSGKNKKSSPPATPVVVRQTNQFYVPFGTQVKVEFRVETKGLQSLTVWIRTGVDANALGINYGGLDGAAVYVGDYTVDVTSKIMSGVVTDDFLTFFSFAYNKYTVVNGPFISVRFVDHGPLLLSLPKNGKVAFEVGQVDRSYTYTTDTGFDAQIEDYSYGIFIIEATYDESKRGHDDD